ncbi:3'-5' exonuclease domain-containing protein 2 [Shewanella sp. NKUCC01_JLK]|uniref:3'-5' exonuclease n=1 Tax=unclassified Shewanella TaxID=196818 RepID=UPI0015669302|nr:MULTISPECIES: 3'-5' exonuclease [unclassified Shewanella]MBW3515622.1 3'-5' exonuclease domain-containing protein 2 [Shewanella sp. NKUCC01_JLK]NRD30900.1 3'-5' exonuclease domain-containing protein 2 [Shewanella sp. DC2-4]
MKLMKYCVSPSKLAWLRKEFGKDADGLMAAMDAAGTAYLDNLNASTEPLKSERVSAEAENAIKAKTQLQAQRQWVYLWLQQRIALTTRIDDIELAALAAFEFQHVRIEVVEPSEFDAVVARLQVEQVLGFDTETRASFERGVQHPLSLIQIATANTCYLFQHAILGEQFIQLKALLEDETILKVGVGLRSDAHALRRQWGINVASTLDLNWALAQLGAEKEMGTRQLVAALLGARIDKPKKVTLSNWQHVPLSSAQIHYAAADALAALKCFNALITQLTPFYHASSAAKAALLIPSSLIVPLAKYFKDAE